MFKKFVISLVFSLLLFTIIPINLTLATTVSLSTSNTDIYVGQDMIVKIIVKPEANNFAEKIEIRFPANILELRSFTLANNWIALPQPEYDLIDNTNGILIKTAGYPSGISSPTEFGTMIFRTKKTGLGSITIGDKSVAFEVNSQTQINGNSLMITAIDPISQKEITPVIKTTNPSNATERISEASPTTTETINSVSKNIAQVQTSNINGLGIILGSIILIIIILAIYIMALKKKINQKDI